MSGLREELRSSGVGLRANAGDPKGAAGLDVCVKFRCHLQVAEIAVADIIAAAKPRIFGNRKRLYQRHDSHRLLHGRLSSGLRIRIREYLTI